MFKKIRELDSKNELVPDRNLIFRALELTPPQNVKMVIVGHEPYLTNGHADGLAYSVKDGVEATKTLKNIFKVLKDSDLEHKFEEPVHGNLTQWAERGVLLLNTHLTAEMGMSGSQKGMHWNAFTNHLISKLSSTRTNIVFMLWGADPAKKKSLIDSDKHLVIRTVNPCTSTANRTDQCTNKNFFDSECFEEAEK